MRPDPLRRLVGIALLILAPASAVEPVYGVVRDGDLHHESAAAAATHRGAGSQDGHGHEDSLPTHQHGTPADHCTHVHGIPCLGAAVPLSFGAAVWVPHRPAVVIHRSEASLAAFHPPRA